MIHSKAGSYKILKKLGAGPLFKSLLARDTNRNREVVIKYLRKGYNKETLQGVMSEVNRFKTVRPHTNVVAVIEAGNGNY